MAHMKFSELNSAGSRSRKYKKFIKLLPQPWLLRDRSHTELSIGASKSWAHHPP